MRWTPRALIVAAAIVLPLTGFGPANAQEEKVLRVIPHADLKNLDPIWTTAYITRNHGYMIYDTLFAMDENMQPQPQMVDTWEVSDDKLTWTFTLRDGLTFHDGEPVTSEDVVASLERWGARDGMGQQLMGAMDEMVAVDDKTFEFHLAEPYGLVLESIGKISSMVPFIMPKRVAETDPFEQVTDYTGSGPFVFQEDQWVPGSSVVYTKFEDYVPREEPPSYAAGGKIAKVDKVIWIYFPDQQTAINALMAGEVDYFEQPAVDLVPILESNPDLTVEINDPLGSIGFLRFNHQQPPFDDVDVRRAALMALDQETYMRGGVGDEKYWQTCYSVFTCNTPLSTEVGSEIMMTADPEQAAEALAATDYDGEPVVLMQATDVPLVSAFALITAESLRAAGFNVDIEAMDWATMTSRRTSRDPVEDGGWSLFHTWWIGADLADPTAIAFSGDPEAGWFGWAEDEELEQYRKDYTRAQTPEERKEIATKVQERLWAIAASGHLGQYFNPVAYSNDVTGLIKSPVQFFWNIDLEG